MASSRASVQNSTSIVFDNRQARTLRLNQSMIATKYRKPRRIGTVGDIRTPDLVGPVDDHTAQEVGIGGPMLRMPDRRPGLLIQSLKAHPGHQAPDTFAPHVVALALEMALPAIDRRLVNAVFSPSTEPASSRP